MTGTKPTTKSVRPKRQNGSNAQYAKKPKGAQSAAQFGKADLTGSTGGTQASQRVKVRMYRQGLGDCFLITLPRRGGDYFLMIDCGVVLGTPGAAGTMKDVAKDLVAITKGQIDLLLVTHEHWDHVSGFLQAKDEFSTSLTFKEVWLAWTEDSRDPLAQQLGGERQKLREALRMAAARMRLAGMATSADEVSGLLEFFGAAGSGTTTDALNFVKGLKTKFRFCRPTDAPVQPDNLDARFYILGPPHDEKLIKKYDPTKSDPETYGIDAMDVYLDGTAQCLGCPDPVAPFDTIYQIPNEDALQMDFFRSNYWAEDPGGTDADQRWRRIDGAWLDASTSMALQLDSATNNTSLVLAIELGDGDVLLFAADAQVGNWLSWQDLKWKIDEQTMVTGPDLLRRTIFYKVGHHGSHNATLREKGLEMMDALQVAMIPVDHQMAVKKNWGNMPLPELVTQLTDKTAQRLIRSDEDVPAALKPQVTATDLFYEITL